MKTVYISFMLHGNMCYDRYTKKEIREKFPILYAAGIRAMQAFPQVTAHIDFPGLTVLSLKHHAPWLLAELAPLIARKQAVMVGCQYAASHAMCADEEADLLAARLGLDIMRRELQADAQAFFNQEIPCHPQSPLIMHAIGATGLVVTPDDWGRPRRVTGLDGQEVTAYPLMIGGDARDFERLYDTHADGDFVLIGGDFELLANIAACVAQIAELASRGKTLAWTTFERYAAEVGVRDSTVLTSPFGQTQDERPASPSFSRWVSDPDDIAWHAQAVRALEALRAAGWARAAARLHNLGVVDVSLEQSWTTEPDNAWDGLFEHVLEYPEVEAQYLSADGRPTLLTRAWHHALIGLNSDASGWVPWVPRTRHRLRVLRAADALAQEALARFAAQLARRLAPPAAGATCVLALNPAPARTVEVTLSTAQPLALAEADGAAIPTTTRLQDGAWSASARVALPAYGYKLLALVPTDAIETLRWQEGDSVAFAGRSVCLEQGILRIAEGEREVQVSLAPFGMTDPTGLAAPEQVTPDWRRAHTRVRTTGLGCDLEVFTEVAWAIWLRLVVSLRAEHIDLVAEISVDLPRTLGQRRFDPAGLLLKVRGQPGAAFYDIPYGVLRHPSAAPAFVAAQRFVALAPEDPAAPAFGLIALGGNQSFRIAGAEGSLAVGLGASKQARPALRPRCVIAPDGTAQHHVKAGPDPLFGEYAHRLELVFGAPTEVALAAHRLRTPAPLIAVSPGDGDWPPERSLFAIEPDTARVTAFRADAQGVEVLLNDLSGAASVATCDGQSVSLGAFGLATIRRMHPQAS